MTTHDQKIYKAFGLSIASEFALPELVTMHHQEGKSADVTISRCDLIDMWEASSVSNKYFVINEDHIMFKIPGTGVFLVRNGREILVSPETDSKHDYMRLYLLGTCMGAILLQRRILPLHGSAIAIDDKAYAIVGDSGAGKSTLASALLQEGCQLLSDDVIPVSLSNTENPFVTPAYPQQKLWQESLNEFGLSSKQYKPIIDRETKFSIPVREQFSDTSLPLAGVFELVKTDHEEIELNPIDTLARFEKLFSHTYRQFFIAPSGLMDWHFHTCAKIVKKIDFYQLKRPVSHFTAHKLSSYILTAVNPGVVVK
ncbi:aldolase [Evansella halocellulosilytica]|uniref:aldolase n=1 Tax=Evansella halocellulosilytica TaxID=2011013 RepID=UPI000BB85C70|nr:aldolase [Evansella halocellulosilytica]